MLNTRVILNCDKCDNELPDHYYSPLESRRGAKVYICPMCDLAQSFYTATYQSRPPGNMSCDADRSSIRYTKSLVSKDYLSAIDLATHELDPNAHVNVLDIGSNRGAFFRLFSQKYINASFLCVETDENVIDYRPSNGSLVVDRFEHIDVPSDTFDLAYCVHTLEHVISAKSVLKKIFDALNDGGRLVLGVPKLELYEDIIEELFIDPHTFHFRHLDILEYAAIIGFHVEYMSARTHHDIIAVLSKKSSPVESIDTNEFLNSPAFPLSQYQEKLKKNRSDIANAASRISKYSSYRPVLIWGAGRIYDCINKQSSWQPENLHLYDKFIRQIYPQMGARDLITEQTLRSLGNDTLVVVASRDYFEEVRQEAMQLGFVDIIKFGDI